MYVQVTRWKDGLSFSLTAYIQPYIQDNSNCPPDKHALFPSLVLKAADILSVTLLPPTGSVFTLFQSLNKNMAKMAVSTYHRDEYICIMINMMFIDNNIVHFENISVKKVSTHLLVLLVWWGKLRKKTL